MANLDQIMDYIADNMSVDKTSVEAKNGISGTLWIVKDNMSRSVRCFGYFRKLTDISSNTTIFTIPNEYKPQEALNGAGFYQTSSTTSSYTCSVDASGNVYQTLGSTIRSGIVVFEYPI